MNSSSCWYFQDNANMTIPCNYVNGSANVFTGSVDFSNYGYFINSPATYAFLALYSVLTFAHLCLGVYWRTWWTLPTLALGGLVEVIGWCGRLQSINNLYWDYNSGGIWMYQFGEFVMQLCCLVIAPTFFSAANYVLIGYLLNLTDHRYSSLDIRSIRVIFITADVLCLVIQAGGGAWAGVATDGDNGAKLMTGGVILQLVVTVIFIGIYAEWVHRWRNDRPAQRQYHPFLGKQAKSLQDEREERGSPNSISIPMTTGVSQDLEDDSDNSTQKGRRATPPLTVSSSAAHHSRLQAGLHIRVGWMATVIAVTSVLIVVRSIYRSIELLNGWQGSIATNEPLFLGMDATMMIILLFAYAIVHPGLILGRRLF